MSTNRKTYGSESKRKAVELVATSATSGGSVSAPQGRLAVLC